MESAGEAQTNRKVTHVEKCGLARVESAADSMGQPIEETVGQLMNTDTSWITSVKRRSFARFVLYFGRLLFVLQEKSAQKKPCSFSVSSLAAWGVRLGLLKSVIALARLLSAADFNSTTETKQAAKQVKTRGGS